MTTDRVTDLEYMDRAVTQGVTIPSSVDLLQGEERHHHTCNCEWCWLGVTNTPPPEHVSVWERFKAWLFKIL